VDMSPYKADWLVERVGYSYTLHDKLLNITFETKRSLLFISNNLYFKQKLRQTETNTTETVFHLGKFYKRLNDGIINQYSKIQL
jgi:hypothetical protein